MLHTASRLVYLQVWEVSAAQLHKHCMPLLQSYFMEVDAQHFALDMLYCIPRSNKSTKQPESPGLLQSLNPLTARKRSPVIDRFEMILDAFRSKGKQSALSSRLATTATAAADRSPS